MATKKIEANIEKTAKEVAEKKEKIVKVHVPIDPLNPKDKEIIIGINESFCVPYFFLFLRIVNAVTIIPIKPIIAAITKTYFIKKVYLANLILIFLKTQQAPIVEHRFGHGTVILIRKSF